MNKTKVVIPDKSWLLVGSDGKIGSLTKDKGKFSLFVKGQKTEIGGILKVKSQLPFVFIPK